jgi:hypothetical protein
MTGAMRKITKLLPLLGALALAACGGDAPVSTPSRRPPPVRPVLHQSPPPPRVLSAPGLEGVIGMGRADLARQFGTPRLDLAEGDARKLQFAGGPCVLDIYLYPPKAGGEPRATYLEARRATDAQEVDRAACVVALRRR